jgi:hypothetical protein
MKTVVRNWRYHNQDNPSCEGLYIWDIPTGWYCQVYTDQDSDFVKWMDTCQSAECTWRFNSGNPMYTVYISDEQDANAFKLKWL